MTHIELAICMTIGNYAFQWLSTQAGNQPDYDQAKSVSVNQFLAIALCAYMIK